MSAKQESLTREMRDTISLQPDLFVIPKGHVNDQRYLRNTNASVTGVRANTPYDPHTNIYGKLDQPLSEFDRWGCFTPEDIYNERTPLVTIEDRDVVSQYLDLIDSSKLKEAIELINPHVSNVFDLENCKRSRSDHGVIVYDNGLRYDLISQRDKLFVSYSEMRSVSGSEYDSIDQIQRTLDLADRDIAFRETHMPAVDPRSEVSKIMLDAATRCVWSRMSYASSSNKIGRSKISRSLIGVSWYRIPQLREDLIGEITVELMALSSGKYLQSKAGKPEDKSLFGLTKAIIDGSIDLDDTNTLAHTYALYAATLFGRCHKRILRRQVSSIENEHRMTNRDTLFYTDALESNQSILDAHNSVTLRLHNQRSKDPQWTHEHTSVDRMMYCYDQRGLICDQKIYRDNTIIVTDPRIRCVNYSVNVSEETITLFDVYSCYADVDSVYGAYQRSLQLREMRNSLTGGVLHDIVAAEFARSVAEVADQELNRIEKWVVNKMIFDESTTSQIATDLVKLFADRGERLTRKNAFNLIKLVQLRLSHFVSDSLDSFRDDPSENTINAIKSNLDRIGRKKINRVNDQLEDKGFTVGTLTEKLTNGIRSYISV